MIRHISLTVAAVILLLSSASLSLGAVSVSIDSSGPINGVYTVQGSDMDGVSGFDLVLNYDNTVLSSPSVSQGALVSGAMFAANPNYSKNSIKIAVVSTKSFSGSGPVATITFATHTGTGSVTIASFNPIDSNGTAISTTTGTPATGSPATGTPTGDTPSGGTISTGTTSTGITSTGTTSTGTTSTGTTSTGTTSTGSSGPTYLGTVTMPSDSQPQNEARPAPAPETAAKPAEAPAPAEAPNPVETTAPGKPAPPPKKAAAIGAASNTTVLERFRAYQGVKTPAIMIALFKQPIYPNLRQEPFVALSDGTTTVTIVADLSAMAESSHNFALNGAKLVSLKKDEASSTWFIEALPVKGALSASLMVLSEDHVTEYPLTIAPAIRNAASTEAEFAAFLKDAAKTPAQHDVNGDGKYDGVDDYIYTANYLVRQQKGKPAAK
jgi:hypothetical protein